MEFVKEIQDGQEVYETILEFCIKAVGEFLVFFLFQHALVFLTVFFLRIIQLRILPKLLYAEKRSCTRRFTQEGLRIEVLPDDYFDYSSSSDEEFPG